MSVAGECLCSSSLTGRMEGMEGMMGRDGRMTICSTHRALKRGGATVGHEILAWGEVLKERQARMTETLEERWGGGSGEQHAWKIKEKEVVRMEKKKNGTRRAKWEEEGEMRERAWQTKEGTEGVRHRDAVFKKVTCSSKCPMDVHCTETAEHGPTTVEQSVWMSESWTVKLQSYKPSQICRNISSFCPDEKCIYSLQEHQQINTDHVKK